MEHCFKMNGKQEFHGYKYTGNSKNDFEQHVLFHESNHFEDDHFECSLCDYVSSNERAIQEHSLSCESIKPPITNENIKQDRLSKEDSLEYTYEHKHIEVKIEDHPFEIELKQENYTKEISTTEEHLIDVETENKQCADFVQHNPAHSLKPSYQCNICKRNFYSKISLRRHKGNVSEKLHQCSLCEKKFCYQVDVERHNKAHTKYNSVHSLKQTYQCNICKQYLFSKISMRRHKGNRSEKPRQCSYCEKKFCYQIDLESHSKSHKIYNCYKCNKTFSTFSERRSHFLRLRCSYCYTCFKSPSLMSEHKSMCKADYPIFIKSADHQKTKV